MKKTFKIGLGIVGACLVSMNVSAQQIKVTDAALKYKAYSDAMMMGNYTDAKKNLLAAREFINVAAENESTKSDPKMAYYRGVIHYGLMEISMMPGNDDLKQFASDSVFKIAGDNLKMAVTTPKSKFKSDAEDFVNNKAAQAFNFGLATLEMKKKPEAAMMFAYSYKVKQLLGIEYEDAKKNTSIVGLQAINEMVQRNALDSALTFSDQVLEILPKDFDIIASRINIALKKGDNVLADKYLAEAIEADPTNKLLYYTAASNYFELKNYPKAIEYLGKSLEIDPNYADAQYQLGAILVTQASEYKNEASVLKFGDPKYDELMKKSDDTYRKALDPLEKYIVNYPNDKTVLDILFKIHKNLKNTEKALEYKKRLDEAK